MTQDRIPLLTFSALLCRVLSWFPLWMLLLGLHGSGLLPASGILLGSTLLSALCGRFFLLHFRLSPRRGTSCLFLTASLCAAGCIYALYLLTSSIWTAGIAAALTFLFTHRRLDAEPDALYPVGAYAAFLTGSVLTPVLLRIADRLIERNLLLAVIGVISGIYFLLRNQFMLHRLVNRRSAAETAVPQDIRRGNLMLVGGVIAVLAVVFIFRAPLLTALNALRDGTAAAVRWLIDLLMRVIARLGGDAPESAEIAEEAAQEGMMQTGSSSPLWLLLWIPVIAAAVYMWHVLLSDWFYDFRIWFGSFLKRLRRSQEAEEQAAPAADAEYYDIETVMRPAAEKRSRQSRRKALRRWKQLPDSPEKFYAGYQLMLDSPSWESDELRSSDTAREISGKWSAKHIPRGALDAVTEDLQTDRYAENGLPEQAVRDMAAVLEQLR